MLMNPLNFRWSGALFGVALAVSLCAGESPVGVVAEVPVEDLAVGLQRGRADMFTIATLHEGKMYDEIYCFADDQAKRHKWISAFPVS